MGGFFTTIGVQTRNRVAKLNSSDGSADITWNPNSNNAIAGIAISGSDVYVGGFFSVIGGLTRSYLAKLNNTDGSADAVWNPSPNNWVRSIAISGTDIYVGGDFTTVGGQTRNRLAKLNNSNGNAYAWNPNAPATVKSIAISGSDIYSGGDFEYLNNSPQPYFALFTDRPLPVELTSFYGGYKSDVIQLNWQTAAEVGNYGFEIEKRLTPSQSQSEAVFAKIGFVPGSGNSNSPKNYKFEDSDLLEEVDSATD